MTYKYHVTKSSLYYGCCILEVPSSSPLIASLYWVPPHMYMLRTALQQDRFCPCTTGHPRPTQLLQSRDEQAKLQSSDECGRGSRTSGASAVTDFTMATCVQGDWARTTEFGA
jgi:hypothetical protein